MQTDSLVQTDKVLLSFYKLTKFGKEKRLALEDVAVMAWKDNPTVFCMRGYKEHPDVKRIERILSNLKSNGFITGGVANYKLTDKGVLMAAGLEKGGEKKEHIKIVDSAEASRRVHIEIERLKTSRIIREYLEMKAKGKVLELLESDLFEFLGTTPRSIYDNKGKVFKERYTLMNSEVVPFCKKAGDADKFGVLITEIWSALLKKFDVKIKKWLDE